MGNKTVGLFLKTIVGTQKREVSEDLTNNKNEQPNKYPISSRKKV